MRGVQGSDGGVIDVHDSDRVLSLQKHEYSVTAVHFSDSYLMFLLGGALRKARTSSTSGWTRAQASTATRPLTSWGVPLPA